MCYYIMECIEATDCCMENEYVNKEPECVNIYIKYNNSYEMLSAIGDIVMSVEVYSGEICSSSIVDTCIEDTVAIILTEIDCAELCSKEEFMRAYNSVMREITDIVGY